MAQDTPKGDNGAASAAVTLGDRYNQKAGRVYLNGSQALVRVMIDQARRDAARGLNTAGFVSGYRGSPLGNFDTALWQAEQSLSDWRIRFEPGVNEDLAATAIWGTQQASLNRDAIRDGVFSLWYGKGPGVDRSADAIKHGNFAGTSRAGGVLVLCGDDHAARSSTVAHQSDHVLIHCGLPVLNPASLQEYLDFGAFGFEMSRFSGNWIGFKCITDTVDSSASVLVAPDRLTFITPDDYEAPRGGLWIRNEVAALAQERRLFEHRLLAAQAFVRANGLDRQTIGLRGKRLRLGIVTTGKSHGDVCEALQLAGLDEAGAARLGIGVFKVAMVWPLEPEAIRSFCSRCDQVLVIEEKRAVIEPQLSSLLFNLAADSRPGLAGKRDADGRPLLSEVGELDPRSVLRAIATSFDAVSGTETLMSRATSVLNAGDAKSESRALRTAAFCAGCPHNLSTRVPEGSSAAAGIGCHGMASLMPDRSTLAGVQMGGEGAQWIGQAPFVAQDHIFQNLGDGTYFHSGLLAIRACVASGVNITYKILLNGVVGMTGGQPIEGEQARGELSGANVANQVRSEGVNRIAVVADDLARVRRDLYPPDTTFHPRETLDAVQRELRSVSGVSLLIYDQACATERRRMRKRGLVPQAERSLFIASEVCEGCGDCGVQSNCIALEPLETENGRKRRINRSTCNDDYSCLKGFCPSFVEIAGGTPRKKEESAGALVQSVADLPDPQLPRIGRGYNILLSGIGGTGIVTLGALLGMAAHIDGSTCTILDMSGFAQRNGSVMTHVRFFGQDGLSRSSRIPSGRSDVVIAVDPVAAAGSDCSSLMGQHSALVVNSFAAPTSAFASNPDMDFDVDSFRDAEGRRLPESQISQIDASAVATRLLGDALGANLILVGHAWQLGLIPLSLSALTQAITLNGAAVTMNLSAFQLGRALAADPDRLKNQLSSRSSDDRSSSDVTRFIDQQVRHLTQYQDVRLAERYRQLVSRVAGAEKAIASGTRFLELASARAYARLLSYKDEYEVARIFSSRKFRDEIEAAFEGDLKLFFNLAPPLLSGPRDEHGRPGKRRFGGWILPVLKILARFKFLRGTPFDLWGYHPHRREERHLIQEFEQSIDTILAELTPENHSGAVAIVEAYCTVRGYGPVKEAALAKARARLDPLWLEFRAANSETTSPQHHHAEFR